MKQHLLAAVNCSPSIWPWNLVNLPELHQLRPGIASLYWQTILRILGLGRIDLDHCYFATLFTATLRELSISWSLSLSLDIQITQGHCLIRDSSVYRICSWSRLIYLKSTPCMAKEPLALELCGSGSTNAWLKSHRNNCVPKNLTVGLPSFLAFCLSRWALVQFDSAGDLHFASTPWQQRCVSLTRSGKSRRPTRQAVSV